MNTKKGDIMKNRIFGKYRKDQVIWGYIFIFPTALGLILLNIWPAIQTAILSFLICQIKLDKISSFM